MEKITFSQVAKWNATLTNPYRTRYAGWDGRYFKVSAETINGVWDVEEIDANGNPLGYAGVALTLGEAKITIRRYARNT